MTFDNLEKIERRDKMLLWYGIIGAVILGILFGLRLVSSSTEAEKAKMEIQYTLLDSQIDDGDNYILISSDDGGVFNDLVNICLDSGYEMQNGLIVTYRKDVPLYSQAMIKAR